MLDECGARKRQKAARRCQDLMHTCLRQAQDLRILDVHDSCALEREDILNSTTHLYPSLPLPPSVSSSFTYPPLFLLQ